MKEDQDIDGATFQPKINPLSKKIVEYKNAVAQQEEKR